MSESIFTASQVKLSRARKTARELLDALENYNLSHPVKAKTILIEGQPGFEIMYDGLPHEVSGILGDTIHNLRSSLDVMAAELARITSGSAKGVYFPFADSAETLDKQIKDKRFDRAGTDSVKLLKSFRPYKDGNTFLRAIHDLDIFDKHNDLLPTQKAFNIQFEGNYDIGDPLAGQIAVSAETIHTFPLGGPLEGLEVVQTVKGLIDLVDSLLKAFARMLALRSAN